MSNRRQHTMIVEARWGCDRCAASGDGRNSLAVAARHHDKFNHPTWAEQTQRTAYGSRGPGARTAEQRSML